MGKRELQGNSIRVLLVDDNIDMQGIIASILKRTAHIDLIGVGKDGRDALSMYAELRPDVLLLDVMMPVMDGIEAASLLRERFSEIVILVLSSVSDHESVQGMMQSKVNGYISKSDLTRGLADSIRMTHQGKRVFSDEAFSHFETPSVKMEGNDFGLTEREREILILMATGMSKPAIAERLNIGNTTVKTHIENIRDKLGVRTHSEAIRVAAKNHLV